MEKRKHIMRLKVRFSDTDMLGHVNNASYFSYMEEARCVFFEEVLGDERTVVPMILASAKVNYLAQTYYRQTLRVESWVSRWETQALIFPAKCLMMRRVNFTLKVSPLLSILIMRHKNQFACRMKFVPSWHRTRMKREGAIL